MLEYSNGTVFNCDTDAIVNTVNCIGVMGAGLALEFGLRYPNMYQQYKLDCENNLYTPGCIQYYKEGTKTIMNFATKWHFKYPSKVEWIKLGLQNFVDSYKSQNITSIAFPKLGTNNGGLDWNQIQMIMEHYLAPLKDIKIVVCLDNSPNASGDELAMLNFLQAKPVDIINSLGKISLKQKNTLLNEIPHTKRFWELSKLDGIGTSTYSKLFNYCYSYIKGSNPIQISIFDN